MLTSLRKALERLDPISLLGFLIIAGSAMKLMTVGNLPYYRSVHAPLTEGALLFRYAGSVGLRILGVIAGIGIIRRKEMGRRLLIGLCSFTIVVIHWKHPLHSFRATLAATHGRLETVAALLGKPAPTLDEMYAVAWLPRLAVCAADVALSAFLIFFFMRRKVAQEFH